MPDLVPTVPAKTPGDRVLEMIRTEFPDYHPVLAIARLAHSADVQADPKLSLDCHKTIAQYTIPRLTSVEAKLEVSETRRVIVSLFEPDDGKTYDHEPPPPALDLIKAVEREMADAT